MASSQVLSAVARRKAALLETAIISDVSPQASLSVTDAHLVSVDASLALPLKRKPSAVSLKQHLTSAKGSKHDDQPRKRSKAERYFHSSEDNQQVSTGSTPQRAYSPSQPLADSSDEDDVVALSENGVSADLNIYLGEGVDSAPQQRFALSLCLHSILTATSTQRSLRNIFNPIDGQNSFPLSPEETSSITGRLTTARVLLAHPGESLVFVGTMQFMLLQGPIELMGVPLLPSATSHRVFAPRSHPIPVMGVPPAQHIDPARLPPISQLSQQLPKPILDFVTSAHSVIIIQELSTGVEGLGQVMRPFKNVFEPDARDIESSHTVVKGLRTVRSERLHRLLVYLPNTPAKNRPSKRPNFLSAPRLGIGDKRDCPSNRSRRTRARRACNIGQRREKLGQEHLLSYAGKPPNQHVSQNTQGQKCIVSQSYRAAINELGLSNVILGRANLLQGEWYLSVS
jgi:hypothetical protein